MKEKIILLHDFKEENQIGPSALVNVEILPCPRERDLEK